MAIKRNFQFQVFLLSADRKQQRERFSSWNAVGPTCWANLNKATFKIGERKLCRVFV